MNVQIVCLAVAILLLNACALFDKTQPDCSVCGKTPAGVYKLLPNEDLPRVYPDWGDLRRANDKGSTVHLCDECIRMRFETRLWTEEKLPQPHFRRHSGNLFGWW